VSNILIKYAKDLRKNMTGVERFFWQRIKNKQLGFKFRRQQRIGSYIVDFVCLEKRLIIELDGGQHNEDRNIEKDVSRDKWLEGEGYIIFRFWNNEVLENIEGVVEKIHSYLSPSP
jgi:very-short-patch-repair endonuclease